MREIKFRGWDGKNMLVPEDLSVSPSSREWLGKYDADLMQYTGLKDKNGSEIYEGDILKWFFDEEGKEFILGPVAWKPEVAIWAVDIGIGLNDIQPEDLWVEGAPYEVVGNIHQNPELLENANDTP